MRASAIVISTFIVVDTDVSISHSCVGAHAPVSAEHVNASEFAATVVDQTFIVVCKDN